MPVIQDRYNHEKIDGLKRYLQREASKGRKRDYEIMVDGFKVVSRTDDVEEFDDYENEVGDNTRNVTITIYDFNANRNTRYSFILGQEGGTQPLNGIPGPVNVSDLIKQRLDERDRDHEIGRLKEKLAETEAKLKEAEEYHEILGAEIEQLKANRFNLGSLNLLEAGAEILKYTIHKNANRSPAAAQLSGILDVLNTVDQPALPPQIVRETEEEPQEVPQLSEQQLLILQSLQAIERVFKPEELPLFNAVIVQLMEQPGQLSIVADLLNVKTKEHGTI